MKFERKRYPEIVYALVNEDGSLNIEERDGQWFIKEPQEPDPELNFEHKMILKRTRDDSEIGYFFTVNVDGTSIDLENIGDRVQLFRAPASIGWFGREATGRDPQIYMDTALWGRIKDFIRSISEEDNYELVPGEKSRIIEGQQMNLLRLQQACSAETLGLNAYDIYFNEEQDTYTFFWDDNAEAITWRTIK